MSTAGQSKPYLDGLPPELIDRITEELDLDTVRNLRLTCNALCDHASGPRFKSFFANQQTDLTRKSLERLCQIAGHPKLGLTVQSLMVLAVVYDTSELDRILETKRRRVMKQKGVFSVTTEDEVTDEELDKAKQDRERLIAQIEEQEQMVRDESDVQLLAAALGSLGKLSALDLEAAIVQGQGKSIAPSSAREWHPIWIRAAQVYRASTLAIARSSVRIEALAIYKHSKRCSVPTWDINEHMPALESSNFAIGAEHISDISLSVSTKVETDYQKIVDARAQLSEAERAYFEAGMGTRAGLLSEDDQIAVAEENYPGVARLLKQMPNLERLDLHLYMTLRSGTDSYAKVFSNIAYEVVLPHLRQCTLRGIHCDETSMLRFLRAHDTIETLEMREVHLVSGSWQPIFAHLCTMPSLQLVTLQNIWAPGTGMVSLASKHGSQEADDGHPLWARKESFPCLGDELVHTRSFSRAGFEKERFVFAQRPTGRQLGSPAFHRWLTSRQSEYGPP
ncbi:MAG: hypothetical protein L6R39_002645 [Caloplaca ligustica]|nr:MAG: hypothetical protein L6R39_002645 [Caloplaca ligustica]